MRAFTLLLCAGFLILTGCQMSPTQYDQVSEGQWEGRILIKDKSKNKSYIVSVDIAAIKESQKLRMDVAAALGTPVATVAVSGQQTEYILFRQKAFYQGKTQPKVLKPILAINMDPRLLFSLLFEDEPQGGGWKCLRDDKDFLKQCENKAAGLSLEWIERKGARKTIEIQHARSSLQINLNSFQPKVVEKADLFNLNAPSGFKSYRIK